MSQQKPNTKYEPTATELGNAVNELEFCMKQTLAFYLWQKHFKPDGQINDECKIVENATFVYVLLNVRMIDEFFDLKPYKTDIKALHFRDFKNPGNFLSEQDRQKLNELIFHLTYKRMYAFGIRMITHKLIERAYKHFKLFMEFAHNDLFAKQSDIQGLLWSDKEWFESLVAEMSELKD